MDSEGIGKEKISILIIQTRAEVGSKLRGDVYFKLRGIWEHLLATGKEQVGGEGGLNTGEEKGGSLRVEPLSIGGWTGDGWEKGTTFSQTGGKNEWR